MWQLLDLLYPMPCPGCDRSLVRTERAICQDCMDDLPRTRFHQDRENQVEKVFWGKVGLQAASAYLYFSKGGKVQGMLHELKYRKAKAVGRRLGELFGEELMITEPFQDVNAIVPVPLHKSKMRKRGFNQAEVIAEGIGSTMDKPVQPDVVARTKATATQTKRSRYDRWGNMLGVFQVVGDVRDKHFLLVDDVLTTGATIGTCAQVLIAAGAEVSVATIATA